jgi:hypothetical protein
MGIDATTGREEESEKGGESTAWILGWALFADLAALAWWWGDTLWYAVEYQVAPRGKHCSSANRLRFLARPDWREAVPL